MDHLEIFHALSGKSLPQRPAEAGPLCVEQTKIVIVLSLYL